MVEINSSTLEDTSGSLLTGQPDDTLASVHKAWAIWTARKIRLRYPKLSVRIYKNGYKFLFQIDGSAAQYLELSKIFDDELRPLTCDISLTNAPPENYEVVLETNDYESELWLNGHPLSVLDLNKSLFLAVNNFPHGSLKYDFASSGWLFESFAPLVDSEKSTVFSSAKKLGLLEHISFKVIPIPDNTNTYTYLENDKLILRTSRHHGNLPARLVKQIEKDEDNWRLFLATRANRDIAEHTGPVPQECFSCLFDTIDDSEICLAELLTIYDRIDLIPRQHDNTWLNRHKLNLVDLQELVRLNRVRLILPFSAESYAPDILAGVSEVNEDALIFSRTLAAKTIQHSQRKEPFLYAPLTTNERAAILASISGSISDKRSQTLLRSYVHLFELQHYSFMMRGAGGNISHGVGAYLGEVFYKLRDIDARLELMTNGAALEWALGLGTTYIPRNMGGYDETNNSLLIASFLGRTPVVRADPATNRMHTVINGLLAMQDVPPLEVARNFNSSALTRFHKLAEKLMRLSSSQAELRLAVEQLNQDVSSFERRSERLAKWHIATLTKGAVLKAADSHFGPFASPIAAWLWKVLEEQLPPSVTSELGAASEMLKALATASSFDAVVVSRSRKSLKNS